MGSIDHLKSVFRWQEERLVNHTYPSDSYKKWVNNQVLPIYTTQLDHLGLLDLVNISFKYEKIDWTFLGVLVAFLNPCINQIQFLEGYMSTTLLDTFVITGCPVIGDSLPLLLDTNLHTKMKCHMKHHKDKVPSYSAISLIDLSKVPGGTIISYKETVDFFWLFLFKFVCATTSKKPIDSLFP